MASMPYAFEDLIDDDHDHHRNRFVKWFIKGVKCGYLTIEKPQSCDYGPIGRTVALIVFWYLEGRTIHKALVHELCELVEYDCDLLLGHEMWSGDSLDGAYYIIKLLNEFGDKLQNVNSMEPRITLFDAAGRIGEASAIDFIIKRGLILTPEEVDEHYHDCDELFTVFLTKGYNPVLQG
jgi:hypothetical protein